MSGATYSHTTRAAGSVLTAAIYNADHVNHITNADPAFLGMHSDTVTEYRTTSDPGGSGTESLPTTLAGELERIRYVLNRIVGKTFWYEAPAIDLEGAGGLSLPALPLSLANGGLGSAHTDPNADRILFWDDSAGIVAYLAASTGLAISGTNISLSHLGLQLLTDPNADRIMFWDDSAGALKWLTVGSGLSLTGTTITATTALAQNFRAHKTANQSIPIDTNTEITWIETADVGAKFASNTWTPSAGTVRVEVQIGYDANATGPVLLNIDKSGTLVAAEEYDVVTSDVNLSRTMKVSWEGSVSGTDTLSVILRSFPGQTVTIHNDDNRFASRDVTWFQGHRIN